MPLPAKPGQPERYEYGYERNGVQNLFLFFCPLRNLRHGKVTDHRTKADYADCENWWTSTSQRRSGSG